VNLSARTQYACVAVVELALHYDTGQPVQIRKIAETHSIPPRFLVQILLQLKAAGLVASTRGASGGYRLTRPPSEISLYDVVALIEGFSSSWSGDGGTLSLVARALRGRWREIEETQVRMLEATTFADLAEQIQDSLAPMYYI